MTCDDIRADEFYAMLILEDEREKTDRGALRQHSLATHYSLGGLEHVKGET